MSEANIWQPRTIVDTNADVKRVAETLVATEGQTVFTLTAFSYALDTGALEVFIDGVYQEILVDYVESDTTSFTLLSPATAGDRIIAVGFTGITAAVDVRDTDIFIASFAGLRAYTGTETTVYVEGKTSSGDGSESFFYKTPIAAPGTYSDDDLTTIVPTGGDGSVAWKNNRTPDTEVRSLSLNYTSDADKTVNVPQSYYGLIRATDTGVVLTATRAMTFQNTGEPRTLMFENKTAQAIDVGVAGGSEFARVPAGVTRYIIMDGISVDAVGDQAAITGLPNLTEAVVSTKPCAAGYTRVSPNLCLRDNPAITSPASNTCIAIPNPSADSTALMIRITLVARSANAGGNRRSAFCSLHSNGVCSDLFISSSELAAQGYEFTAIATTSVIAQDHFELVIRPSAVGGDISLSWASDVGGNGILHYSLVGYYD